MIDTYINLDGSPWGKLSMSFKPNPEHMVDQEPFDALCDSIQALTQGEIEFTATQKPCFVHREGVWRDLEFLLEPDGTLIANVYVCCRQYAPVIAPSMPQLESFIKRKLKLVV
jgi:hypothetical protein